MLSDGAHLALPSIATGRDRVLTAEMPLPAFPRTKVQRHIRLILIRPTQGGIRVARSGRHIRCVDSGPSQCRVLSHRCCGTRTIFLPRRGNADCIPRQDARVTHERKRKRMNCSGCRGCARVPCICTERTIVATSRNIHAVVMCGGNSHTTAADRMQMRRQWHLAPRRRVARRPLRHASQKLLTVACDLLRSCGAQRNAWKWTSVSTGISESGRHGIAQGNASCAPARAGTATQGYLSSTTARTGWVS